MSATCPAGIDTSDGGVYSSGRWAPEYEARVGPGEALVFPPGYLHETFVRPADNPDGGCTVATTFQMAAPAASRYLHAWLPRLAQTNLQTEERLVSSEWSVLALAGLPRQAAAALRRRQTPEARRGPLPEEALARGLRRARAATRGDCASSLPPSQRVGALLAGGARRGRPRRGRRRRRARLSPAELPQRRP